MLLLCVLTIVDVMGRWIFAWPIPGFYEIAQLALAIIIAGSFPAALAARANLTIDFLAELFGPRTRTWLAFAGAAAMLPFVAITAWRFGFYASELGTRNAATMTLNVPLAPFWWTVTAFLVVCVVVQTVVLAVAWRDAREGRVDAAGRAPVADHGIARAAARRGGPWVLFVLVAVAVLGTAILLLAPNRAGPFAAVLPHTPTALAGIGFATVLAWTLLQIPLAAALGLVLPRLRDPGRADAAGRAHRGARELTYDRHRTQFTVRAEIGDTDRRVCARRRHASRPRLDARALR